MRSKETYIKFMYFFKHSKLFSENKDPKKAGSPNRGFGAA